jgi:hypothetical protein
MKTLTISCMLLSLACSPVEEVGPSAKALVSGVTGFRHTLARSKFKPQGSSAISDAGFSKVVGATGVFAVDELDGSVLATPNAGAPSTLRPPYPGNSDAHNARVVKYFVDAGLPAYQILDVHANTLMRAGIAGNGSRVKDEFVAYYSIVRRQISGVRVVESLAWARFNSDDEVVEEQVHWPDIPASVVRDALDLQGIVSDSGKLKALQKTISATRPDLVDGSGEVGIHHPVASFRRQRPAFVTYDMSGAASLRKPTEAHFDKSGVEVRLPHEEERLPQSSK